MAKIECLSFLQTRTGNLKIVVNVTQVGVDIRASYVE